MATLKRLYFVAMILLIYGLAPRPSWAGSKLINVQGKLTDSSGNPLSGAQTVIFRLYNTPTGAYSSCNPANDPNCVWYETQGVTPQNGLFNISLGSVNSLASIPFNKPYYLGMQVAGDNNELSPRQLLGASAYALGSLSDFSVGQNLIVSSNVSVGGNQSFNPSTNGIVGTITTDNAAPGNVGEYVVSSGVNVPFPGTQTYGSLTSLYLTPGDWDITAQCEWDALPVTITDDWVMGISEAPGNDNTGLVTGDSWMASHAVYDQSSSITIANLRRSISVPTNFYMKVWASYSAGAPKAYLRMSARRIR